MSEPALLAADGLTKSFKGVEAVRGIDLAITAGEIVCLVGPNGAGKSTTINMICATMRPGAGTITYHGREVRDRITAYQRHLGIVPQDLALYEDLTALANVRFFASLYGLRGRALKEGCERALAFTGLEQRSRERVRTFSGGMKRRLNIACAIAHDPELLIMDEPTVGIDPQSRNHILEGVRQMRAAGTTILYTTHYMEEVAEIATRVVIMDEGRIIAQGTCDELCERIAGERSYLITTSDAERAGAFECAPLLAIAGVRRATAAAGRIEIATSATAGALGQIIVALTELGVEIRDVSCQIPNLETVFLRLTGKALRD